MDQGIETGRRLVPERACITDYIFLLRPIILIPVWTFFLLGACHASGGRRILIPSSTLLYGILSFTALMGAVYIINQITDRESDLANDKLFLISRSIIPVGAAWAEAAALVAVSFALGTLLPGRFLLILAVSLLLGLLYSIEPVRLKKRAALDVAANAVGSGILNTAAGWVAAGAPMDRWTLLLPYPLAVASVHVASALADIEGDRAAGLRTSGVLLGRRKGLILSASLMTAASAAAVISGNRPALYASLLSLPAFFAAGSPAQGLKGNGGVLLPAKAATVAFSVAAAFYFPLYLPLLAVVVIMARLYYGRRFGLSYPSL